MKSPQHDTPQAKQESTQATELPGEEAEPDDSPGFFVRYWRGGYPLDISYWIMGVVLILVLSDTVPLLVTWFLDISYAGPEFMGAIMLFSYVFFVAFVLWQAVGLWRSAERYRQKGGRSAYATLAQITLSWWILYMAYNIKDVGAPLVSEASQLITEGGKKTQFAIHLQPDGKTLEVAGAMSFGATRAVKAHLYNLPQVRVICLNTQGGEVLEGLQLHQLINRLELSTQTTRECTGPCSIAFLGGTQKYLSETARLGFHNTDIGIIKSPTIDWNFSNKMAKTMAAENIPSDFIKRAISTSPEHTWYPSRNELREAGIINIHFTPPIARPAKPIISTTTGSPSPYPQLFLL